MVTTFDPTDALETRALPSAELRRIYDTADRSRCSTGSTAGQREDDTDRAARLARQSAARQALWLRTLPRRFYAATPADIGDDQDPGQRARQWRTRGTSQVLVLTGEPGRGKTHLGYAIGNDAVRDGVWTIAYTVADLNAACRPSSALGYDAYDYAAGCDLLLLDDLGREQVTDWTLELLQRVLDARSRERRRTIVTTNLTGAEVRERYGQPVLSRLSDSVTPVRVVGPDRRTPDPW